MDDTQLLRYSRHILLDELGIEGQEALLSASVLMVEPVAWAALPGCIWAAPG